MTVKRLTDISGEMRILCAKEYFTAKRLPCSQSHLIHFDEFLTQTPVLKNIFSISSNEGALFICSFSVETCLFLPLYKLQYFKCRFSPLKRNLYDLRKCTFCACAAIHYIQNAFQPLFSMSLLSFFPFSVSFFFFHSSLRPVFFYTQRDTVLVHAQYYRVWLESIWW